MPVWAVVLIAGVFPWPTFAACPPKLSFCQKLPDHADKASAIFLGIAKRVATPAPKESVEKDYPIARFEVTENFAGAESTEFEVRMTSDFFIGSIPQQTHAFREGEVWLVEAYYDTHEQQWMTSTCQRTRLAEQAGQDLQVLRSWAAGQRLPARITGQVVNPGERKNVSAARVDLRAAKGTISTTADDRGEFSFDNVEPGYYEATTEGARSLKIDLTRAWCSHVVFLVK